MFKLRFEYVNIFKGLYVEQQEKEKQQINDDKASTRDNERIYKIKYCLNILPSMNEKSEHDLMEALCNTEELDIFATDSIRTMINYKWATYGFNSHCLGCIVHICYIVVVVLFISDTYLYKKEDFPKDELHLARPGYMVTLAVLLLYPLAYDGT